MARVVNLNNVKYQQQFVEAFVATIPRGTYVTSELLEDFKKSSFYTAALGYTNMQIWGKCMNNIQREGKVRTLRKLSSGQGVLWQIL